MSFSFSGELALCNIAQVAENRNRTLLICETGVSS